MGDLDFKVIDNFLEKENFKLFQKEIFNIYNIPWFFRNGQTPWSENDVDDNGYFSLGLFNNFQNDFLGLNHHLINLYNKLNIRALHISRANLTTRRNYTNKLFFHTDVSFECLTAIFYMNTCNGATILDKEKKIKIDSVENRVLIFNSKIEHASQVQSDEKRRIVININYF